MCPAMMKVLHIIPNVEIGGAEIFLSQAQAVRSRTK
jgi:hypothetical protein